MLYSFVTGSIHTKKLRSRLSSSAVHFLTESALLRFEPSFGGLGAMYAVHLRLIRKCVVDFLLVIIERFLLGVMAEAL